MKPFHTAGMIFYSIVAATVVVTVSLHLWQIQRDLNLERQLNTEFRSV